MHVWKKGGRRRTTSQSSMTSIFKRSPADKEVHGRVQVLVLHDSRDDQDVLQQGDETQDQKDLSRKQAGSRGDRK